MARTGYYKGKYYVEGEELELSQEIKDYFEELRREDERVRRKDQRYFTNFQKRYNYGDIIQNMASQSLLVEEEVLRKEEVELVRKALALLSDEERDLINLIVSEGLSEREIGEKIGISQAAVNKRKTKIFHKLKRVLLDILKLSI